MTISSRLALLVAPALVVSGALASEPFPSTYQAPVNPPVLIQGATVLTGNRRTPRRCGRADRRWAASKPSAKD